MYDNMTTYMLAESPESAGSNSLPPLANGSQHHINGNGGGGSGGSDAPSLIGSPRSTPVFGNGHVLKVNWIKCITILIIRL